MVIRNPPGWAWERFSGSFRPDAAAPEDYWPHASDATQRPTIDRIDIRDLGGVLQRGFQDFSAYRTDVVFLCIIYPVVGLLLGRLAAGYDMLPLLFPLASGFALVGPFAAVGLNEMSRRRELGMPTRWIDAFGVFASPALSRILLLGLALIGLLLAWLVAAQVIYDQTLGPLPPASIGQFADDVLRTGAGHAMIVVGVGVGFLFAVLALAVSVVSFPLLLDRNASLEMAVRTSLRAVAANPVTMAAWGLVITAGLVVGSIPALIGLAVVMPVLGHATWHLYRRVVRW